MTTTDERDRHDRIVALFAELCDLAADEQRERLAALPDDADLLDQVRALLGLDQSDAPDLDGERVRLNLSGLEFGEAALPESIGEYKIVRLLGRGGMGTVFEAEQSQPLRRVALKVVNTVVALPAVLRRFEHEAEILGRLQHPGIAQIIEAGTFDEGRGRHPFFAMEYVKGRPLDRHVRGERLSGPPLLELFAEICDAVHHAHQRGVIHRDLKPANILVTEDGRPKVLDFGVARATADESRETLLTAEGQIVGTLSYMSPEQANGEAHLDTTTDVYSLGVILYELLAGRLPFEFCGKPLATALREVVEQAPPHLATLDGRYRGDLDRITRKALEKDKGHRYDSAAALAADVRRHLRHEPISAQPPSSIYQLRKFARRHRALVSAASIVVVGLVSSLAVSLRSLAKVTAANAAETQARTLAEREAATATAINEFVLQDMLRAANPFHGGRHVRVVDVLDAAIPRIDAAFSTRPLLRASVRLTLGRSYHELGLWKEAERVLRQAAEERAAQLGEDDPMTLVARYEHALTLGAQHDPEALPQMRDLQERWQKQLGPEHPRVLRLRGDIANLLAREGLFDEAVPLARESYQSARELFGDSHDATLANQRKLAEVLESASQYAEAGALFEQHHTSLMAVRGPHDPDVLDLLLRLATVRLAEGMDDDAERLVVEAIAGITDTFGESNVRTLAAKSTLASLLDATGRSAEATELHRALCADYEKELGGSHEFTLVARSNLAVHLRRMQRYDEAEDVARDVLEQRRRRFGEVHEMVAESLDVLGAIEQERDHYDAAAELYAEALSIASATYGDDHPRTIDIRFNRASLALSQDDFEVAEAEFRRLIEADSRLRGPDHPFVAAEKHQLGMALAKLGRDEEAVTQLAESMGIRERIGHDDRWQYHATRCLLGKVLTQLGRAEEAEEHVLAAYRFFKEAGDERRLRRYEVVEALIEVYRRLGREDRVEPYQSELDAR